MGRYMTDHHKKLFELYFWTHIHVIKSFLGFGEVQGIIAKVAYAKRKNKSDLAAYVYRRTLSFEQKRFVARSTGVQGNFLATEQPSPHLNLNADI